jgi:integrase
MANKTTTTKTSKRTRGEGSISQKANGTYLGRITISGYAPYSCTGKTEKEVEKKLREFKIRTIKGEIIPRKQTVNAYISNWLTEVKKPTMKAASYDRLERTFEHQIRDSHVGRSQMGNLTSMDVQKLLNSCVDKNYSYSTIKKVYQLLNNCFNHAVAVRDIQFNPVNGAYLPKEENIIKQTKVVSTMMDGDLLKLEHSIDDCFSTGREKYRYAAAYTLIANTGLRSGEALALRWDHVDLENRVITVNQNASRIKNRNKNDSAKSIQIITSVKTKTGIRTIPINDTAYKCLLKLKAIQKQDHNAACPYVIATSTGKIVVQNSFYRIFQRMQEELEISPVTVHALRHTFATNLIKQGTDIKVVSQLLGHSSVRITYDTYVHTDLTHAIEAVNKLNTNTAIASVSPLN